MRIGLGLGLFSSGQSASTPTFDPATLALSGWWKAPYVGSPLVGTASAGASNLANLSEATNPPGIGASLNGLATMDFDGTNDVMGTLVSGATGVLSDFHTASAGSGWALVNLDAISSSNANGYQNDAIWATDSAAYYTIAVSSTGPTVYAVGFDGAFKAASRAISTGAWALVTWRHNGTNVQVGVNEAPGAAGGASSVACGNITSLANNAKVGRDAAAALFLNGRIAELATSKLALSDANFASVKSYINATYGLSL